MEEEQKNDSQIELTKDNKHEYKISSQAWPEINLKDIQIKSNNHYLMEKYLNKNKEQINSKKFEINKKTHIRSLNQDDMDEIKNLHQEWFPLNYPDKFYDQILKKPGIIALGCFIEIEDGNVKFEIMIGSIICKVKSGKDDIIEIYDQISDDQLKDYSYALYLMNRASCKCFTGVNDEEQKKLQGCYILTLGIIDECRQLGLGTYLLNQAYQILKPNYPLCKIVYLHVVDYNKSAIQFYQDKNQFKRLKIEENHYEIFEKEYNAIVLYRQLYQQ